MKKINELLQEKERKVHLKLQPKFTQMQSMFSKAMGKGQRSCWERFSNDRVGYMECMLENDDKFQRIHKRFDLGRKFFQKHNVKCMEDAHEAGTDF